MYCKYANLTKVEIESCVIPFISSGQRGFKSQFNMSDIFRWIVHKLKTGYQWKFLFVAVEGFEPPFSWQTVYYYYRKWCRDQVFEMMFRSYLLIKKLNLDGTHSLVKGVPKVWHISTERGAGLQTYWCLPMAGAYP